MTETLEVRIELTAVRALTEWESVFSDEVRRQSRQIAEANGNPELISLSDYQQAARIALEKLTVAILTPQANRDNGQQKVA